MTQIVLLGGALDGILVREPFRHQVTPLRRMERYCCALERLAARGVMCPNAELRRRLGRQYQSAWRRGVRPDLRFIDLRRTPLEPVWDPARGDRRRGRAASHVAPGRANRVIATVTSLLAALLALAARGASAVTAWRT